MKLQKVIYKLGVYNNNNIKLSYKNLCVKFDEFQGETVHFSLKNEGQRGESIKMLLSC